jgi:phosphate starvation-inducible protein PhoH
VAGHVVRATKIAFMQGRNILDAVVILHESVNELNHKKLNDVILKIDFENTYDKLDGIFLNKL